ncbi:MAG: hypothetical protein Q7R65_01765 [bacterium]|nr:hypothetical protein [bacterium]
MKYSGHGLRFRDNTVIFGIVLVIVFILTLATGWTGLLVPESKAVLALETQGFSGVKITDRAWFMVGMRGGDKSDCVRFTATATNPVGKKVQVYVFSGWLFKGATIRTP